MTDLYTALANKAKQHAATKGLSDDWAYGFLNAMWPTIDAAGVAASRPSKSGEAEIVGVDEDAVASRLVRPRDEPTPLVIPAYLGWNNAERDKANVRLYATDKGNAARWDKAHGGRVAEYALSEHGATEGDRLLVVWVGDRFVNDLTMERVVDAVQAAALAALAREFGGQDA